MQKIARLSLLVLLFGCATPTQKQIFALNQSALAQLNSCAAAAYASPEAAPVRARLPENLMSAPADEVLPTEEEAQAFAFLQEQNRRCRSAFLEHTLHTVPAYVPAYAELFQKNEAAGADLIDRKITWADYVRRLKQNIPPFEVQYDAASKRLSSGLSTEDHLSSHQRAVEAVQRYQQSQKRGQSHCCPTGNR